MHILTPQFLDSHFPDGLWPFFAFVQDHIHSQKDLAVHADLHTGSLGLLPEMPFPGRSSVLCVQGGVGYI